MGTILKYNDKITYNAPAGGAIVEGLLYGLNTSGVVTLATNAAAGVVVPLGVAVRPMSAANGARSQMQALAQQAIIECLAGEIEGGTFTVGAIVYLHTTGFYTTTSPKAAAAGTAVIPVGIAMSATRVAVNIVPGIERAQAAGTTLVGAA